MQQLPTIPQSDNEPDSPAVVQSQPPGHDGWRSIISTVAILITAPLLALILTAFVFQSYQVDGQSMQNTLQDKDRLIVLKLPRTLARVTHNDYIPKRGEVVIFVKHGLSVFGETQDTKQLIKRVVGLPGEHVIVRDGKITVYNQQHPEGFNPDVDGGYTGKIAPTTPGNVDVFVPQGEIFVCGDNRTNSIDSRTFGPISTNDLIGKLVLRLLPIDNVKLF